MVAADINGDGLPDIVTGGYWLKNNGDGTFCPMCYTDLFEGARIAVADINGDGLPDIVAGEEALDPGKKAGAVCAAGMV